MGRRVITGDRVRSTQHTFPQRLPALLELPPARPKAAPFFFRLRHR